MRTVGITAVQSEPGYTASDEIPFAMDYAKAAELLNVDRKTVQREVKRGNLRAFRVGRAVRISREAFLEYTTGREKTCS